MIIRIYQIKIHCLSKIMIISSFFVYHPFNVHVKIIKELTVALAWCTLILLRIINVRNYLVLKE